MENSDDLTVNILSMDFECNGDDVVFVRCSIFPKSDGSEATAFFHRLFVVVVVVEVIASDSVVAAVVVPIVFFVFSIMRRSSDVPEFFAFVRR